MSWRWVPNAICVLRMLLAVPLALLLLQRSYVAALCVLVIAGASDGLDGFLAKTFDWRTRLGGLLDPVKAMVTKFLAVVPNMVAAFLIGFVGWLLGKILAGLVTNILASAGADHPIRINGRKRQWEALCLRRVR